MLIYVASTIQPEVSFRDIYSRAAKEIVKLGHQPFNPYGSDGALLPWPFRLEALSLQCQGMYLLTSWQESELASTERYMCLITGKSIFYQSAEQNKAAVDHVKAAAIERIKEAIHEATGMTLDEYRVHSRKEEFVFARMIFSHYAKREDLSPEEISSYLDRNKSMVYHYFKRYADEVRYTPTFRKIVAQVEQILGVKQQN